MKEAIIGISAFYHDSAVSVVIDGKLVAAVQEERFTRIKHDPSFPTNALRYILDEYIDNQTKITAVAFYEKPYIKFERLLETYHAFAPRGLISFLKSMPVWIKDKIFIKNTIKKNLDSLGIKNIQILFPAHHLSHAASAFYPSPFNEAAILTVDGVGEWSTTTIGRGNKNGIEVIKELSFPHSLGLLYSAVTFYCGFRVNSGEYKLMGLAPYGNDDAATYNFVRLIEANLIDVKDDGSFLLNMKYFNYATGLEMTNDIKWEKLFGLRRRMEGDPLTQDYMNLSLAIQKITDRIMVQLASTAKKLTGCKNLVMAGGVALNCVANGRIAESHIFENIWIQPAAGDAGGAIGAALSVRYIVENKERIVSDGADGMMGSYLGPEFHNHDIEKSLQKSGASFTYVESFAALSKQTAKLLRDGNVVGWFQGRMEFGPRALGNRSILADPANVSMQKKINLKIKFREGFRPFAPAVLEEDQHHYFEGDYESPYMLFVKPLRVDLRIPLPKRYKEFDLEGKLYFSRSSLPAITHIDYSARVQTVSHNGNQKFWQLINDFKSCTGIGMIINTSFNVRGEPMVCTPEDAYRCFMRTEMDYLIIGNYLLDKREQPFFDAALFDYETVQD